MNDFVNIEIDNKLNDCGQSPIIKCLTYSNDDFSTFKKILNNNEEKAKRVIKLREILYKNNLKNDEILLACQLLGRLISAKFSGKSQSMDAIELTLLKIVNGFKNSSKLIFTICFGGYKNYHSPSFPEVDFAELWNLNYMVTYLYPLIKHYPHGVTLEYESEEISIQFNNVEQKTTDKYTKSFQKLIKWYVKEAKNKYNLELDIKFTLARSLYESDEALYELMKGNKETYIQHFASLGNEEREKWIQRADSNFMVDGIIDYSNVDDDEKYELLKNARINNESFLDADYVLREKWFNEDNRIPLTGTWGLMPSASPIDGWLHIKSTSSSRTDFWIGTGVLEKRLKEFSEVILSVSNYEDVKDKIAFVEVTNTDLIKVSTNFKKITIITN